MVGTGCVDLVVGVVVETGRVLRRGSAGPDGTCPETGGKVQGVGERWTQRVCSDGWGLRLSVLVLLLSEGKWVGVSGVEGGELPGNSPSTTVGTKDHLL